MNSTYKKYHQIGYSPCNIRTDKWALAMNAMDRVNNYKLNEYLKKGEAETPKAAEGQAEGGTTPPYRDWETDRKSTRLNSSHRSLSRMPSSA